MDGWIFRPALHSLPRLWYWVLWLGSLVAQARVGSGLSNGLQSSGGLDSVLPWFLSEYLLMFSRRNTLAGGSPQSTPMETRGAIHHSGQK